MAQKKPERPGVRVHTFFVYSLTGAIGTALQYAILLAMVSAKLTSPVGASCLGALAGAAMNYWLNYRFVFRSVQNHTDVAPRFFVVALAGFLQNWLMMTVLIRQFCLYYLIAQTLTTACVLALTFLINSMWTFKNRAV
jgi:putative flippase GtrA